MAPDYVAVAKAGDIRDGHRLPAEAGGFLHGAVGGSEQPVDGVVGHGRAVASARSER